MSRITDWRVATKETRKWTSGDHATYWRLQQNWIHRTSVANWSYWHDVRFDGSWQRSTIGPGLLHRSLYSVLLKFYGNDKDGEISMVEWQSGAIMLRICILEICVWNLSCRCTSLLPSISMTTCLTYKILLITGHEGPFMTSALRWGVGGQHHAPAALPPGKDPVPIVQEAGWAPGPVWTGAENLANHRDSIPGPSSP